MSDDICCCGTNKYYVEEMNDEMNAAGRCVCGWVGGWVGGCDRELGGAAFMEATRIVLPSTDY